MNNIILSFLSIILISSCCPQNEITSVPKSPDYEQINHVDVNNIEGMFSGWPANNGIWYFPETNRLLVGYSSAPYDKNSPGHKIVSPDYDYIAESYDNGISWKSYQPENYVDSNDPIRPLEKAIDFSNEKLALRVKYGSSYRGGRFYYSYDEGRTFEGPFPLLKADEHQELDNKLVTARTDYLVIDETQCVFFISAKPLIDVPDEFMSDKTMCIETRDGGRTFQILSWVVPLSDPYRAVMPSSVKISDTHFVTTLRRKTLDTEQCWIDAYGTKDGGKTWEFLSRVGETGWWNNGNPPAFTRLHDGTLCCVYANRDHRIVYGRYSGDNGKTWGEEFEIRKNIGGYRDADIGYPKMTCLRDGTIVVAYYWVSKENPEQYIEVAIWNPE